MQYYCEVHISKIHRFMISIGAPDRVRKEIAIVKLNLKINCSEIIIRNKWFIYVALGLVLQYYIDIKHSIIPTIII